MLFLAGCGGGGGGTNPISTQGVLIAKATGGTVSLDKATLAIPADALPADTRIFMQKAPGTLPAAPGNLQVLGNTAYDLTPNGLTFTTPATLTIRYSPASLAPDVAETDISVYTIASGEWRLVPGTTVDPTIHAVSIPLGHFSVYALLAPKFSGTGPAYDITVINPLPGDAGVVANGLSSNGYVCGYSITGDGSLLRGIKWKDGVATELGTRDGDAWSIANSINSSGVAVGASLPDNSSAYPVKFENGKVTQLETAFGMIQGTALSINDNGDIVIGDSLSHNGTVTRFLSFNITSFPGFFSLLNSKSEVAGHTTTDAALWRDGAVVDAGVLAGYDTSEATAISNASTLAGFAKVNGDDNDVAGFYWDGATMAKIAPISGDNMAYPAGVNSSGVVVGRSSNANITSKGFLWQSGVTTDLTKLVDRQTGWTIINAYAINDAGQILVSGLSSSGLQRPLLLTPRATGKSK